MRRGLVVAATRLRSCHLTIRSSRDCFAARLARYRVPQRRAATQSGLTQVLGGTARESHVASCRQNHSCCSCDLFPVARIHGTHPTKPCQALLAGFCHVSSQALCRTWRTLHRRRRHADSRAPLSSVGGSHRIRLASNLDHSGHGHSALAGPSSVCRDCRTPGAPILAYHWNRFASSWRAALVECFHRKCRLTIRSSRDRFAASANGRKIVPSPRPQIGPA